MKLLSKFKSKGKVDKNYKAKIALLYDIPKSNLEKYNNWTDGFTKAIDILEDDYTIDWINISDSLPSLDDLNTYNFIIAKCCWGSSLDKYLRKSKPKTPIGIAISCSIIPTKKQVAFYDVLWFETFWYRDLLPRHKRKIHAFGISTSEYKPKKLEKTIDVLSIGAITGYKRHEKIINQKGKNKLVVGDLNYVDSTQIISNLNDNNINIKEYVSAKDLSDLINKSNLVYIPCSINGGGERAVLEARSCNIKVKIEQDNPKLKELLSSPIWDERYYSLQIKKGIEDVISYNHNIYSTNKIEPNSKLKTGRDSFHNGKFNIKGDEYVEIGSFCSFGENLTIITSNHDTNYLSTQGYIYRKYFNTRHPGEIKFPKNKERTKGPVIIGNDVWIGDDVKIMSGVTIGDGACIGANSIVTKDIPPYEIHAGIPNKRIKARFNDDVVEFLFSLKWWNWSDIKIKNNKLFFETNLNDISTNELKNIIK